MVAKKNNKRGKLASVGISRRKLAKKIANTHIPGIGARTLAALAKGLGIARKDLTYNVVIEKINKSPDRATTLSDLLKNGGAKNTISKGSLLADSIMRIKEISEAPPEDNSTLKLQAQGIEKCEQGGDGSSAVKLEDTPASARVFKTNKDQHQFQNVDGQTVADSVNPTNQLTPYNIPDVTKIQGSGDPSNLKAVGPAAQISGSGYDGGVVNPAVGDLRRTGQAQDKNEQNTKEVGEVLRDSLLKMTQQIRDSNLALEDNREAGGAGGGTIMSGMQSEAVMGMIPGKSSIPTVARLREMQDESGMSSAELQQQLQMEEKVEFGKEANDEMALEETVGENAVGTECGPMGTSVQLKQDKYDPKSRPQTAEEKQRQDKFYDPSDKRRDVVSGKSVAFDSIGHTGLNIKKLDTRPRGYPPVIVNVPPAQQQQQQQEQQQQEQDGDGDGEAPPAQQQRPNYDEVYYDSSRNRYLEGELKPFLPVAGGDAVKLDPGENRRKKIALAMWESQKGKNPNGTLYNNRLLRKNQYNWDLRMRDDLFETPFRYGTGTGQNLGLQPWGSTDPRVGRTKGWNRRLTEAYQKSILDNVYKDRKDVEKYVHQVKQENSIPEINMLKATDQSFLNNPSSMGVHHPQEDYNESNVLDTRMHYLFSPLERTFYDSYLPAQVQAPIKSRVDATGHPRKTTVNLTSNLWKPPIEWQRPAVNPQFQPPTELDWDKNTAALWNQTSNSQVKFGISREPNTMIYDSRITRTFPTAPRAD